eukprot:gene25506-48870_t
MVTDGGESYPLQPQQRAGPVLRGGRRLPAPATLPAAAAGPQPAGEDDVVRACGRLLDGKHVHFRRQLAAATLLAAQGRGAAVLGAWEEAWRRAAERHRTALRRL